MNGTEKMMSVLQGDFTSKKWWCLMKIRWEPMGVLSESDLTDLAIKYGGIVYRNGYYSGILLPQYNGPMMIPSWSLDS